METRGSVGLIVLNRPDALNALSLDLREELADALESMEADASIGAVVITGSDKAFAAGADIKAMLEWDFAEAFGSERRNAPATRTWAGRLGRAHAITRIGDGNGSFQLCRGRMGPR